MYRLNIHHIYCYATLHFVNHRLFIVDTNFKKLSSTNTDQILNALKNKYLEDSENELYDGMIDNLVNRLLLEHNHYLSVKYIAGDLALRTTLANVVQEKQRRRVSFEIKLNTALAEYL